MITATLLLLLNVAKAQQSVIDSLEKVLATTTIDTIKIDLMIAIADKYRFLKPDKMIEYSNQALTLAKQIKDSKRECVAINRIGYSYWVKGNLDKALQYFQESLSIAQKINDESMIARGFGNIALIYSGIGNYQLHISYSRRALQIFEKLGNEERISVIRSNIAEKYVFLNQYDSAKYYLQKALPLAEKNETVALGDIYTYLAKLSYEEKEYEAAIKYLEKGLLFAQKFDNRAAESIFYQRWAEIELAENRLDLAESKALRAVLSAEKIQSKQNMYQSYQTLSKVLFAKKDFENAYKYKDLFVLYKDSVQSQTTKNALQIFEYERKQGEVALLKAEQAAELAAQNSRQKWLTFSSIAGLLSLSLIAFFVFRSRQKEKKANMLLQEKNEEIAQEKLKLENVVGDRTKEIGQAYQNVKLLSEIGQDIIAVLSVEKIIEIVYEKINVLIDATTFAICIYDEQKAGLEFSVIERGKRLDNVFNSLEDKERLAVWCFLNQAEVFINDREIDDKKYIKSLVKNTAGEAPESIIYLPLSINDKKIGAITVQSFQKNAYTPYHLDIVKNIASYVSIALDNAILYEGLEQKVEERTSEIEQAYHNVELLSGIGKKITANLSVESVIKTVYTNVNELMDANVLLIGLYSKLSDNIDVFAMEKGILFPSFSYELSEKNRPAIWCFENNKEVIMNDFRNDYHTYFPDYELPQAKSGEDANSLVYLPLFAKEKVIGVLSVQSFQKNAYTEYHLNILRNLAIYTAIALENAENFHQIAQQNVKINAQKEEIASTLENLQTTQAQLIQAEKLAVMGKLVASVAHEINTPLGAIRASAGNIVTDLNEALQELPKLFQMLSAEQQENFFGLVSKALENKTLLSSREERIARKQIEKELEGYEIADADELAYELTNMGIYENISPFLPIFKDENALFITKIAYHLVNQQRSTDNIQVAVDRASKVVFALKTYARHDQSGEKMKANVSTGIETVLILYHNQLKQSTEIIRNYSEIPEIFCYPDELNQVWTNLIHNAMQAMTSKGTLEIGIKKVENSIEVSIKDSGSGMPEAIKPKIFDAFFTTKPEGEGSGLGLDIVKKIIDKHEGTIGFESEEGKGTTFWVRLPM